MKDLAAAIFNILKYAGKTVTLLRNLIFNVLFFSLLVVILIAVFFKDKQTIDHGTALILTLNGDIVEQKQLVDPFGEFLEESLGFADLPQETLLQDIIDAIDTATTDSRIRSIVFDLSRMGASSLNQLRDIGLALDKFKAAGKKVIAAEDFYSQNKYYLASYADSIFLNPVGVVDLHGLSSYRLYFKDALEKLKINYHVFRVGSFKSALEPVTRNSMSDEAKEQNRLWLNTLWQEYITEISSRREIDRTLLDDYTNSISTLLQQVGGDTAQLAVRTGLVDGLKSRHELRTYLAELTGQGPSDSFQHIRFKDYLKEVQRSYTTPNGSNAVGIIIAKGNILTGEQPPGVIGSETLVQRIRKARNNDSIRAVVLRLDTGGGSVMASEIIRREVLEFKKSGKTFVVSMGSMAASGGYWISADADEIWAHPTTITGSIGIFGAIPTFENSLAHLGIYSDGVGTTQLASGMNLTQPLSAEVKAAIQMSIEHGYQKFLDIVVQGRGISPDKIDDLAQGRVFDGVTAQKLGLVDNLGNLENAIAAAAALEGLDNYDVHYIQGSSTFTEKLLESFQENAHHLMPSIKLPEILTENLKFISPMNNLSLFKDPKGIYAHCLINYL